MQVPGRGGRTHLLDRAEPGMSGARFVQRVNLNGHLRDNAPLVSSSPYAAMDFPSEMVPSLIIRSTSPRANRADCMSCSCGSR